MTTSKTARGLPGIRWWHKWVGIGIGILLIAWTGSGVVMMMPRSSVSTAGQGTGAAVDWTAVTVSPARAAQTATADSSGLAKSVDLQRLRDAMVYVVRFEGGRTVLVDASSGSTFRITSELAGRIAQDAVPRARVRRVDHLDWGGFRVELDDPQRTEAIVAEATGGVSRTVWRDRVQERLGGGIHTFQPLSRLPGHQATQKTALVVMSLIALVSVLTGYWLALPRRWRGPV